MLNNQILKLREELNDSIINGENYDVIYKISTELDELISKYYKEKIDKQNLNHRFYLFAFWYIINLVKKVKNSTNNYTNAKKNIIIDDVGLKIWR